MPVIYERGYLIPAIDTNDVNYVDCAVALAKSIKDWHPDARVCLLTNKEYNHPIFDIVNLLPYGDQTPDSAWKLNNDWQVFAGSPFRQTIKLEADMIASSPIDHWWTLFENKDIVVSLGCRDFYNETSKNRYYRKVFDANNLPDVYNAITYWRISNTAKEFFKLVRQIFNNWSEFRTLLKFSDDIPTTDVVYAMAVKILGEENHTLPAGLGPTIVHMKKHIIPLQSNNWTTELVWEHTNPGLRINTVAQWGFVHYHIKEWINE